MARAVLQRCGQFALTLFAVAVLIFFAARLTGDPVSAMLGQDAGEADIAAVRAQLGLDKPLSAQFTDYLSGLAQGDLGTSLWLHQPVGATILQRLPATFELAAATMVIVLVVSIALGSLAAVRQGGAVDKAVIAFTSVLQAMPPFWAGPLLILAFAVTLPVFPVFGGEGLSAIVLPALTLSALFIAQATRVLRSELVDALRSEFILAARGRGLDEWRVVFRHAARVASIPVVTVLGLQFGTLLGGAIITETIFAWPGVGQLMIQALNQRDYPLVQGCVLLLAAIFVFVNFLTELLYTVLDPRVRHQRAAG